MSNIAEKFLAREQKWSIEDVFNNHYSHRGDFYDHMHYLADYSAGKSVVEFGFNEGQSTVSFLMSASRVRTFDINTKLGVYVDMFTEACELSGLDWKFEIGDSVVIFPEYCDILFIDTDHNGDQIYRELITQHEVVNDGGVIIMHDTQTFPDMWRGINTFLNEKDWEITNHRKTSNGLTTLSRK